MNYANGWELILHAQAIGLALHIVVHFAILPTASRLWDWALQ